MNDIRIRTTRILTIAAVLLAGVQTTGLTAYAQGRGRGAAAAPTGDPVDLTGYYVAVVTEDWRFRMVTPAKGEYPGIPLNPDGKRIADAWDPAKDEAAGEQCKAYGAPALMRIPGRIHITKKDENMFQVETDAGTQTRLFHLKANPPATSEATLQGYSAANWEVPQGRGGRGTPPVGGSLKVVTTHLKPGYLRKNGVPYSADTVLTEYYSKTAEPNGDSWLIITTVVEDPKDLNGPFITSTNFKKQATGSGWAPSTCTAR
jgi:hypothetical protein